MPFNDIEVRVEARPEQMPASIRLRPRRHGRVSCIVGIRMALLSQFDWKAGEMVKVQIGTAEQAGLMRLVRVKDKGVGALRAMKNRSGVIDLGFIEAFGTQGKVKMPVQAVKIDRDTIQINLPDWDNVDNEFFDENTADKDNDDDDGDDADNESEAEKPALETPVPKSRAARPTPPVPAAPQKAPPLRALHETAAGSSDVTHHGTGITVSRQRGVLRVGNDEWNLSEREALILAPLVSCFGTILGSGHLIQRAGLPASSGASIISVVVGELESILKKAGLKIVHTRGIGYCLNWR